MTVEERYNLIKNSKYAEYMKETQAYERRNLTREELLPIWQKENAELKEYLVDYENPYMSIKHFYDSLVQNFLPGQRIVIQEKIDGSNAHMRVYGDSEAPEFKAYGQNYELNEHNSLSGFFYFARDHKGKVLEKYYNLDIYGEWLTPHSCVYPPEAYGDFYVFDVMENGKYWEQDKVQELAEECGFSYAPVFYAGEFISWEHIKSFIGQTRLGGKQGEGIVLKNQTTLNSSKQTFYAKIVSQEFQEILAKREHIQPFNLESVIAIANRRSLAETVVTLARTKKIINKMVTDGTLSANWVQLRPSEYTSAIIREVYKDCNKEAPEVVKELQKDFGKLLARIINEQLAGMIRDSEQQGTAQKHRKGQGQTGEIGMTKHYSTVFDLRLHDYVAIGYLLENKFTRQSAFDFWFTSEVRNDLVRLRKRRGYRSITEEEALVRWNTCRFTAKDAFTKDELDEAEVLGLDLEKKYGFDDTNAGSRDKALAYLYLLRHKEVPKLLRDKILRYRRENGENYKTRSRRYEESWEDIQNIKITEFIVDIIYDLSEELRTSYRKVTYLMRITGLWETLENTETVWEMIQNGTVPMREDMIEYVYHNSSQIKEKVPLVSDLYRDIANNVPSHNLVKCQRLFARTELGMAPKDREEFYGYSIDNN